MTILHLTTFLQGGAGRCITDLAVLQQQRGASVAVVTSLTGVEDYDNYGEYLARLEGAGMALYRFDSLFTRDLARSLQVVERVRAAVPMASVDIIHAHAAMPALIGLLLSRCRATPIPVIQTLHGWGIRKTGEQRATDVAILRQVDHIVTTSEASRQLVIGMGIDATCVTVVPCGLPDERPAARPGDPVAADLEAARARGARVLVCIGSVTENKNQRLLVDAMANVLKHHEVFCAFVGEGTLIDELRARARSRSVEHAVVFYGYRSNAAAYLAHADLLVLPSRTEGQGLTVLEAFRAGVPAVVSDAPALTELVTDGETGFVFHGQTDAALAGAIVRALSLPDETRRRSVERAGQRFAARYTLSAMVDAHEQLYADFTGR